MTAQNANTVLAMQNVDVLRAIQSLDLRACVKTIADATDRDQSNLRKTLGKLEAAGLIASARHAQIPLLTDAAKTMLKAADVAEGHEIGIPGFVGLYHVQILSSALNPRRDFDSDDSRDALDELRQDILQNGLLQNLLVRPMANPDTLAAYIQATDANGVNLPLYEIIAGERRWRAIGAAIADGDWPEDRLIPCQVITTDDRGHTLRALAENLQRRSLNPLEEAHAFKAEVEAGMSTAELAERLSVTQRYIQLRMQLLELSNNDQARLILPKDDPQHLTVTKARKKLQQPKAAPAPTVSPHELLILAEVMHKVTKAPANGYQTTECAPNAREIIGVEFAGSWLSFIPCAYTDGRSYVSIGYNGREALSRLMPDFAYPVALNRLRCEVLGEEAFAAHDAALYVTPWLNGPWEPSAEATAKIAEREALEQAQKRADQATATRLQTQGQGLTTAQSTLDGQEQESLRRSQLTPLAKLSDPSTQQSPSEAAPIDQDREALTRYRAVTHWIGSDSWDGCGECIDRLRWAAESDSGRDMTQNQIAEAMRPFLAERPAVTPAERKPFKILVDADWLRKKIAADPDMDCEVRPAPVQSAYGLHTPITVSGCTEIKEPAPAIQEQELLAGGWLPIVLCPTDGEWRLCKLPDGSEVVASFQGQDLGPMVRQWRVREFGYHNPARLTGESFGGVERIAPAYDTAVIKNLPEGVYPIYFRPNDTVHGHPALRAQGGE